VSLKQLSIRNVRCIEAADLDLSTALTLLSGANGSGKTSVLESIYILGRGRSFRIRNSERLIRYGQAQLRVTGYITGPLGEPQALGVEVSRTGTTARIAGHAAESLAELSQALAVQVIDPGVHRLVEEGGYRRRRWMDWAVFHVEPQFVDTWLRYMRVIKQRNAALKLQADHAAIWDPELARLGESISASRQRFVEALQPYWREEVAALSGLEVELHYHRGWSQEQTLEEALAASRLRDASRQLTHVGPHRADIALRLHGRAARDVLSRGQQKLVAIAMTLAQLRLLQQQSDLVPTLLLDDPAAELDGEHLQRFIARVALLRCQRVVTSLHAESRLFGAPEQAFRVEQGRLQPL
jgi:DNA replication and repair protein RecF